MGKSMCTATETLRSHMPDDLALCILSKLPVKSLKRFGCVCKSWSSLLENPHFMSIYRNTFISNHHSRYDDTSLFLQTSMFEFFSLSGERYENITKLHWPNPFEQEKPWFWIWDSGSISSILCLYAANKQETVVMWNPTTDKFKVIPSSPLESVPPYQIFQVSLEGFGYDHIRDDYKLIRTISYLSPSTYECEELGMSLEDVPWEDISHDILWEMYSLRSNSWRRLDNVDDFVIGRGCSASGARLYIDGICHWWYNNYSYPPCNNEKTLVSFDLVNEVFYTTPIPLDNSPLGDFAALIHMVVFNGSIALITWFDRSTIFDISILGELGAKESWTKIFTVGPLSCVERPIGIGKTGDLFFEKIDGEAVWIDLGSQKLEELGVIGKDYSHILIYKENLPIGGISLI